MNSSIFEHRSRFAMIGALMVIISLLFLFFLIWYIKKYIFAYHNIYFKFFREYVKILTLNN